MAKPPGWKVQRDPMAVEGKAIVTFDSANPDTLSIRFPTEMGDYEFVLTHEQAMKLRYLLGRALRPANTAVKYEMYD